MFELLKYAIADKTEKWTYQVYEPNKLAENFGGGSKSRLKKTG